MLTTNRKIFLSKLLYLLADIALMNIALFATLLLSYDLELRSIPVSASIFLPISTVATTVITYFTGVHRISWKHGSFRDVVSIAFVIFISSFLSVLSTMFLARSFKLFSLIEILCIVVLSTVAAACLRVLIRHFMITSAMEQSKQVLLKRGRIYDYGNTMIIGGGIAAEIILNDMHLNASFSKCKPVAIIDDNPSLIGNSVRGVRVVGTRDDIVSVARNNDVKTIFFAIPSATNKERRDILNICAKTGCDIRIMSSVEDTLAANDSRLKMRKVRISDLLGRDMININTAQILGYVENKTVMVTGGGGSIGSELCRQIAKHNPKKLIIFDIYENTTYDILNELRRAYPELDLIALIGSVRDEERLNSIFDEYRPDIVYHAAAHKHVPLMEDSPREAIKNNVFGTLNTVRAADKFGVKRFVMISTDKAVNPTNIMGATKRVCEMIIQSYNKRSKTDYVAVRFGNVLGSNGSVIPLFEKQIENGGPVTVTHPDIIRYFMTIPEAVSLVLSAGAFAKGGEIFVLDMGEPVKILDLAENMIRLSGYEPYHDIDIVFSGLRPGEKLYEELLMNEEGLTKTDNSLIYIGKPIDFDDEKFLEDLEVLGKTVSNEEFDARQELHKIVSTFKERKDD